LKLWLTGGPLHDYQHFILGMAKGDGMGGLAASGGSMFSSARSAEQTLNRISWTLLAIFIGLAVVLSAGWLGK
jgi:preprotein translocase subunit SecG